MHVPRSEVKAGDRIQLETTSMTLEGQGVGQLEQREVLCPGLFPGERARVRIEAMSRHHPRAHARSLELIDAHPQRRAAPCVHHAAGDGRCTGCPLMELEDSAQREAKRGMLRDRFGLEVDEVKRVSAELGYRMSAKRVAFSLRGELRLGSHVRTSHRFADMSECLVDHPRLQAAFSELAEALRTTGLRAYHERTGEGDLRFVWGKTDGVSVVLTLVVTDPAHPALVPLSRQLRQATGLVLSQLTGPSNSARGVAAGELFGSPGISLSMLGETVEVPARSFLQPNPRGIEQAYMALLDLRECQGRTLAFDLYAGAGLTTRALSRHFAQVQSAETDFEQTRAAGVCAQSVEAFLQTANRLGQRPDLVVANPPRKGLGRAVCDELATLGPENLHIMSCGPEGLARDLAQLRAAGYRLKQLSAFDTLPQTPHLELVARLHRPEKAEGA